MMKRKEAMPITVSTREFRVADFGEALSIWKTVEGVEVAEGDSEPEVKEYLLHNPGLSRVAVSGETIVGAVLCGHDGRRGLIYHLAVAPAHQGKGIGRQLLQECIRGLHGIGITRALILVSGENAKGRSFWLRNGWEEVPGVMLMGLDI
jgi:ribosomal protein S18 acetylase RimI-like enzyme